MTHDANKLPVEQRYPRFFPGVALIAREEGFRGLVVKGLWPTVAKNCVNYSIRFPVYLKSKELALEWKRNKNRRTRNRNRNRNKNRSTNGDSTQLETRRTQEQHVPKNAHSVHSQDTDPNHHHHHHNNNNNNNSKYAVVDNNEGEQQQPQENEEEEEEEEEEVSLNMLESWACGAVAGGASCLFSHPMDVVKAQMMSLDAAQFRGSNVACIQNVYRLGGLQAFYTGRCDSMNMSIAMYWLGKTKILKHAQILCQF